MIGKVRKLLSIFSRGLAKKFVSATLLAVLATMITLGIFFTAYDRKIFSLVKGEFKETMIENQNSTEESLSSLGDRNISDLGASLQDRGTALALLMAAIGINPLLGDADILDSYVQNISKDKDVVYAVYLDRKGEILTHSTPEPQDTKGLMNIVLPVESEGVRLGTVKLGLSKKAVQAQESYLEDNVSATVEMQREAMEDRLRKMDSFIIMAEEGKIKGIVYATIIVSIVLITLILLVGRRIVIEPIEKLRKITEEMMKGNLDARVKFPPILCWKIEKCGKKNCPSYDKTDVPCWYVAGTLCKGAVQGTYARKIGDCKKCEIYSSYVGDEIQQLSFTFNEMTENLSKSRDEIITAKDYTENIIKSMIDTLIVADPDAKIKTINKATSDLLGYSEEELIGNPVATIFEEELSKGSGLKELIKKGFVINVAKTYLAKEGRRIPVLFSGSMMRDQDGRIAGIVCVARDITEHKRAEEAIKTAYDQAIIYAEQLKEQIEERIRAEEAKEKLETQLLHAQKMEAIGTLAGGIAHDFNNLLQVISGYVQLLLMRKDVKDTEHLYLKQIDESARKASELTKQLLIFGRKVESKLITLSLNQEIIEIYKLFQRTIPKMIDIELDLAENLKLINADPVQLEQIMMNLGLNAKDAMPDGGKLTFETKNVVLDQVYCRTHVDIVPGEYVELKISDTGYGMDKGTLEHIFEPFYTTKETGKGTGLGLAIVYGLVESHGGHIMCYSEPGQGTTFKIYFPALLMEDVEQGLKPGEEAVILGGHETVLIVDDEEALRNQGRDMLAKYGYTAITAESGERAIEIYEKEKDRIDLVILDIGMPGIGGYKCIEQLVKIDPEIKVIIASGYATSDRVEEMLKSGAADFIDKPYRLTDMLKKVREVLDQG